MIKDSTSSHTWAIFLLKRDFYEKSIFHGLQDPPKSEVKNEGYQQYLFKITEILDFLSKIAQVWEEVESLIISIR